MIFGKGKAFGTFGELLQGVLPNNRNFLVTFPVARYSYAEFSLKEEESLIIFPPHKHKTKKLIEKILHLFHLPLKGTLILESDLLEGKGMASSSADLVAATLAIQDAYELLLHQELIEKLIVDIEPTDGVMYEGVVSYYQTEVMLRSFLGRLPPLKILAVDEGGQVDTIQFNEKRKSFTFAEKHEYERLLINLEKAIRTKKITEIGQIATCSSISNQKLKPNKCLELMLQLRKDIGGLGVAIAHSGTYIGVLLDATLGCVQDQLEAGKTILAKSGLTTHVFESL